MKRAFLRALPVLAAVGLVVLLPGWLSAAPVQPAHPRVLAVEFDNDVNPVTQDYVVGEIHRAAKEKYNAVVILLDTPGGLSESMRNIVKAELASPVPVIVYVSPNGARAASAGVWLGEAADILAMAPQTNIGSSTPIQVGGANIQSDLRRKVVNDAAAQLRALAQSHGRNVKWADAAVRVASNLSASEALQRNVIDDVAPTLPALLNRIDGEKTVPKGLVLDTRNAAVDTVHMGLWKRILDRLIDPNIITLLLSLGVLGIVVELWHPGLIFPATFGALSLIIAFWGLQVLPISWAGLLLLALAFAFWIAELFVGFSHGALALAGAACFVFGSLLLFEPAGSGYQTSLPLSLAVAGAITAFFAFALVKVIAVRRRPVAVGTPAMLGAHGITRNSGFVSVKGELWRARYADAEDDTPPQPGHEVEVVDVDGLELVVRPLDTPADDTSRVPHEVGNA
jgi:membrane-bound serine protease (ClpP class)